MNLCYSSIDEVWPDFNKKIKKKKVSDPICDLYEKNDAQINKYATNNFNKSRFQKDETSQRLFHQPEQRKNDVTIEPEQNKYNVMIDPEQNKYDIELEGAPLSGSEFEKQFNLINPSNKSEYNDEDVKKIISEVHQPSKTLKDYRFNNEIDEENTSEKPLIYDHNLGNIKPELYDHKSQYIRPELHKPQPEYLGRYHKDFDDFIYDKISNNKSNSLAVLDIILYIASGIILIFLLEQFVRIGTQLSQRY